MEIEPLLATLGSSMQEHSLLGQTAYTGMVSSLSVLIGSTGIGKVNAAATTAALLERFSIEAVWNIGCAGAYPSGPLSVGDVLVSQVALCGDEGVLTRGGPQSGREIGIPLASRGDEVFYDAFPLHNSPAFKWISAITPPGRYILKGDGVHGIPRELSWEGDCFGCLAAEASFQVVHGPSLTVGMSSGDPETAQRRFEHYLAFAENMEGSAIAQTCMRYGAPMLECRGMSNVAGERDKRCWRMHEALSHCHGVARTWLKGLGSTQSSPNRAHPFPEMTSPSKKGIE